MADGIAVFGDYVIRCEGGECNFVALRDILSCLQRQPFEFKLFTGRDGAQRYSHCIPGIHFH
ncbi:hypothetical protein D3C80_2229810 [compost metagenome]